MFNKEIVVRCESGLHNKQARSSYYLQMWPRNCAVGFWQVTYQRGITPITYTALLNTTRRIYFWFNSNPMPSTTGLSIFL